MTTYFIANPYEVLARYALGKSSGISENDVRDAKSFAERVCSEDPPLLEKFLSYYPPQNPMRKVTVDQMEEAGGLLHCIWRGEYDRVLDPEAGPYVHFKGETYLCYGKALLIQGPKEDPAVVYSNKAGDVFVRPLREWVEIVKWSDGKYRPRYLKESLV
jgi:hypothetical protein